MCQIYLIFKILMMKIQNDFFFRNSLYLYIQSIYVNKQSNKTTLIPLRTLKPTHSKLSAFQRLVMHQKSIKYILKTLKTWMNHSMQLLSAI